MIVVVDLVGENCVTPEDGELVFEALRRQIETGQETILDFTGVKVFASSFFNTAIGKLYGEFSPDQLNALLKIKNLTDDGRTILKRVIENSKRYYADEKLRFCPSHEVARLIMAVYKTEGGKKP